MLFEQLQRKSAKVHPWKGENFNYFYTCTVHWSRYNFNVRKVMICHVVYTTSVLQHFITNLHAGLQHIFCDSLT